MFADFDCSSTSFDLSHCNNPFGVTTNVQNCGPSVIGIQCVRKLYVNYYYSGRTYSNLFQPYVKIEKYVLLEGIAMDVLKFVALECGEQCVVMNTGITLMLA